MDTCNFYFKYEWLFCNTAKAPKERHVTFGLGFFWFLGWELIKKNLWYHIFVFPRAILYFSLSVYLFVFIFFKYYLGCILIRLKPEKNFRSNLIHEYIFLNSLYLPTFLQSQNAILDCKKMLELCVSLKKQIASLSSTPNLPNSKNCYPNFQHSSDVLVSM